MVCSSSLTYYLLSDFRFTTRNVNKPHNRTSVSPCMVRPTFVWEKADVLRKHEVMARFSSRRGIAQRRKKNVNLF